MCACVSNVLFVLFMRLTLLFDAVLRLSVYVACQQRLNGHWILPYMPYRRMYVMVENFDKLKIYL